MRIETGTERFAERQEDGTYKSGEERLSLTFSTEKAHDAFELGSFITRTGMHCLRSGGAPGVPLTVTVPQDYLLLYLFNSTENV